MYENKLDDWIRDKDELIKMDINEENVLKKFSKFIVQTLDKII